MCSKTVGSLQYLTYRQVGLCVFTAFVCLEMLWTHINNKWLSLKRDKHLAYSQPVKTLSHIRAGQKCSTNRGKSNITPLFVKCLFQTSQLHHSLPQLILSRSEAKTRVPYFHPWVGTHWGRLCPLWLVRDGLGCECLPVVHPLLVQWILLCLNLLGFNTSRLSAKKLTTAF